MREEFTIEKHAFVITAKPYVTPMQKETLFDATATRDDLPVTNEQGELLEFTAGSEADAVGRMRDYLHGRFAPRQP